MSKRLFLWQGFFFLIDTRDRQAFLWLAHLLAFQIGFAFLLHLSVWIFSLVIKATWRHASRHLGDSVVVSLR